jgi:hypothetical protein
MELARSLWLRVETLHAVTYFDEATTEATSALGIPGFWMGYFGCRAAPMGAVSSAVVEATFFNFAPSFVARWVPAVWDVASPSSLLEARRRAAAVSLRRWCTDVEDVAARVSSDLGGAVDRAVAAGRPLFAANRDVDRPSDPVECLWQLCTCLREHRGDGHVAALTAMGVDGCAAHVLIAVEQGSDVHDLQRARGWTPSDWQEAVHRCMDRGWIDADGGVTADGGVLRQEAEATTDRLALQPFEALSVSATEAIVEALDPLARAVSSSGVIRYPNPMGLPPLSSSAAPR